ncbi:hypothetical protein GCM10018793_00010 [Streptomyces sulfonofaciens]|uniref:Uncharacterized protein n=1 Tax=Streptomyces sulfonofaciens TaxID=68272 RepID=A0A919KQS4_9ACTN|nr:hypothetical protein GCM10018793_00010 [Streptomyces sulfonofaciens]
MPDQLILLFSSGPGPGPVSVKGGCRPSGIERQIEQVRRAPAPDAPAEGEDVTEAVMGVTWLTPARPYR